MSSSVFSNTVSLDVEEEEPVSLSDLVRTAETSRLRRRGAITGAHRARQQSSASLSLPLPSALAGSSGDLIQQVRQTVQVPTVPPPWVGGGGAPAPMQPWVEISDPTKAEEDGDGVSGSGYALYCGVETWEFGDEEPFEPSPLPLPLPSANENEYGGYGYGYGYGDGDGYDAPRERRIRKSTGCGALVHLSGTPRVRGGTWQACGRASACVVPLDKVYFERGGQSKLFSCGCRWHGVGCSNCGNALGNVYMPCQVATTTSSLSRDPSRPSRNNANTPPNSNAAAHFVYTFFYDAVTSAPEFDFSTCPAASTSAHQTRAPLAPTMTMDGAAGGFPSWDGVSEYAYGYGEAEAEAEAEAEQEEPGAEYDPNGVLITNENENEPGSPDKPSAETMLWPAR